MGNFIYFSHLFSDSCKYKFDFENQRRKPTLLAKPLLTSNSINFAINSALLTV